VEAFKVLVVIPDMFGLVLAALAGVNDVPGWR